MSNFLQIFCLITVGISIPVSDSEFEVVFITWNQENAAQSAIEKDLPYVFPVSSAMPSDLNGSLPHGFVMGDAPEGHIRNVNPELIVVCEQEALRKNDYVAKLLTKTTAKQYTYVEGMSRRSLGWTKGTANAIKLSFLIRRDLMPGDARSPMQFTIGQTPEPFRKGYLDGKGGLVTALSYGRERGPNSTHAFACVHLDKGSSEEQEREASGVRKIIESLNPRPASAFMGGDMNYRMRHYYPFPGMTTTAAGNGFESKTRFAYAVLRNKTAMHAMLHQQTLGNLDFKLEVDTTQVVAERWNDWKCNIPGSAGLDFTYGPTYARKVGAESCARYDKAIALGNFTKFEDISDCFFELPWNHKDMLKPTKDLNKYEIGGLPVMKNFGWLDHVCTFGDNVRQGYDLNSPGAIASDHMPIKVHYHVTPDW